jgi:glucokinase
LGDVGGTNIRLVLKQVDLQNPSVGKVIKDGKTLSQQVKSFEEAVTLFLDVRLPPLLIYSIGI